MNNLIKPKPASEPGRVMERKAGISLMLSTNIIHRSVYSFKSTSCAARAQYKGRDYGTV